MTATPREEKKYTTLSPDGFFDANDAIPTFDETPDSGIHDLSGLDSEAQAKLQAEWQDELTKCEEEIQILRQVLAGRLEMVQKLKRKLGITAWKEFKDDMGQGLKNIQESTAQSLPGLFASPAYQKTSETLKVATEKTTSTIGILGASVSKKLGDVKNSNAFKSFEEKVGTAYSSVKTKVSNSRSSSVTSFEQSLNNLDGRSMSSKTATPVTSPIAENKPLA